MKNLKFKKFSLLLIAILFLSIVPVKASSLQKDNHSLVNEYLNALKNNDIESVVKLSKDYRESNDFEYKIWLEEILKDPNQRIVDFTILDKDTTFENYSIVYAQVEFFNGDIIEVPLRVENGIVYIDKMDNLPKIKTGIEIEYSDPTPEHKLHLGTLHYQSMKVISILSILLLLVIILIRYH